MDKHPADRKGAGANPITGIDFQDPFFDAHWEGMRQAGLYRGAYHYLVVPSPWENWNIWQWKPDENLPRISPMIDLNRVNPGTTLPLLLIPKPD